MNRKPSRSAAKSAANRARWLAELAAALDEAHRLSLRLSKVRPDTGEAIALRSLILALRTEVDGLRRGADPPTREHDSIWPIHHHWQ